MVVNDSLIIDVINSFTSASIGAYVNQILLWAGGIAGITLIYFTVVIYYQYRQYKQQIEQLRKLDEELIYLSTIYQMHKETSQKLDEIHKLLILNNTQNHYDKSDNWQTER